MIDQIQTERIWNTLLTCWPRKSWRNLKVDKIWKLIAFSRTYAYIKGRARAVFVCHSVHRNRMDRFPRLFSFLILVSLFTHNATVTGSTSTTENNSVMGIIGAIVDNSSRVGKEESVAMKMALEDFYNYYNQSFVLHVRNSPRKFIQAAFEGNNIWSSVHFSLLSYLQPCMFRYETIITI